MKRLLILLIPVIAVMTGCNPDDNGGVQTSIILSDDEIVLENAESDARQVTVRSNGNWTASLNPASAGSWLSVSPSSGRGGTTTVTILIQFNGDPADRSAEIVFSSGGDSAALEITQPGSPEPFINANNNEYTLGRTGGNIEILLSYNTEFFRYEFTPASAGGWIRHLNSVTDGNQARVTFAISPLDESSGDREASIVFFDPARSVTETVRVIQVRSRAYSEGNYIRLQSATIGNGVNLIIMGDGYTEREVNAEGIYERDMREAMEDMFSVYPYDAYRQYFNVWMVVGISQESGTSVGNNDRNTRFGTWITGQGTAIELRNESLVTRYARSIPGLPQNSGLLSVLMVINSPIYAGTCIMYSTGYSISLCPRIESPVPNTDARAVVIHEFGGHGFGRLADEYSYGGAIPASERNDVRTWQTSYSAYQNVDFTSNATQVLWRDFFNYTKYTRDFVQYPIGVYEGGLTYTSGVYRPEEDSCMNDNIDYFNAPSRYSIVRRIMAISGMDSNLTLDEFVRQDNPRPSSYDPLDDRFGGSGDFVPLGNPVRRE